METGITTRNKTKQYLKLLLCLYIFFFFRDFIYTYSKFYKPIGPIFLLVVSPYPLSHYSQQFQEMSECAKEFNGLCVQLEHWYYGASYPVP